MFILQTLRSGDRWDAKPELEKLLDVLMEFNYQKYGFSLVNTLAGSYSSTLVSESSDGSVSSCLFSPSYS